MVIHPNAVVADGAQLGSGVEVGPFCVVGPRVVLQDRVVLHSHVVIDGDTEIGAGTEVFPFASLGVHPQDKKVRKEDVRQGRLRIGSDNVIRESVTIHPGTPTGRGITTVGNGNMFLVGCHIAHDAEVGSGVVLTNLASIAGHTVIEDKAVLGAMVGIHQFVRVGTTAMVGAGAMVSRDVPPYCLAQGDRARLIGLNQVGLRRSGITGPAYAALRQAFRHLFWHTRSLGEVLREVEQRFGDNPYEARMVAFIQESRRGVCVARRRTGVLDVPAEEATDGE
jgi:UDP-N-acetylglucosamine acyltransferase